MAAVIIVDEADVVSDGYSSAGGGYSSPGYSTDEGKRGAQPAAAGSGGSFYASGECTVAVCCCGCGRVVLARFTAILAILGAVLLIWAAVDGFITGTGVALLCLGTSATLRKLHYGSWRQVVPPPTTTASVSNEKGEPIAPTTVTPVVQGGGACAAWFHSTCGARHAAPALSTSRCAMDAALTVLATWCLLLVFIRGVCSHDFVGSTFPPACYPNWGGRVPRGCVRLAPGAKAVDAHGVPPASEGGTDGALAALSLDASTARALAKTFLMTMPVARVVRGGAGKVEGGDDGDMLHVTTLTAGWGFVDDLCAAFTCDAATGKTIVSAQFEQRFGSGDGGLSERRMRGLQQFLLAQEALLPPKSCTSA